jgi:two-component system sensor histidine kinase SenX3
VPVLVIALGVALAALAVLAVRHHGLRRQMAAAAARLDTTPPDLGRAIDALHRADAALRSERTRLAGALHATRIGIVITDQDGVVVFANQAAAGTLAARHGEAVAEVRIREAIAGAIEQGGAVVGELELYTPVRRVLLLSAVPLDLPGEDGLTSAGAAAFIQDVTDERRVAAMRRDFVANAGHELKTPLGALAVLAETLAAGLDEPDAARRLASRLEGEARRLADLVDDLLDLSQAEGTTAVRTRVGAAALMAAAVEEVTSGAPGARVVVEPAPPGLAVAGDEHQLRTLLVNLVDNGVKYGDPGGAGTVRLRAVAGDSDVTLEVEDDGIGIGDAHADRIFERFYRVDRGRSRSTGGTGLGLSIVRNIAAAHGGEVSVESKLGEGSIFRVRLPRWVEP